MSRMSIQGESLARRLASAAEVCSPAVISASAVADLVRVESTRVSCTAALLAFLIFSRLQSKDVL